ncbi:hypothetical protein ACFPN4_14815 [Ureibacillus thermophilus]
MILDEEVFERIMVVSAPNGEANAQKDAVSAQNEEAYARNE